MKCALDNHVVKKKRNEKKQREKKKGDVRLLALYVEAKQR